MLVCAEMKSYLLILLIWLPHAHGISCEWLLHANAGGKETYILSRNLSAYDDAFTPLDPSQTKLLPSHMTSLGPQDILMDIGAGEGHALRDILPKVPSTTELVAVSLVQPPDKQLEQALAEHENLVYLAGQSFEGRFRGSTLDKYKGQCSAVFDVLAAGTYGRNPFETVPMEAQMLKRGGILFTMVPLRVQDGIRGRRSYPVLHFDFAREGTPFESIEDSIEDSIYDPSPLSASAKNLRTWISRITGVQIVDLFVTNASGIEYMAIILRRTEGEITAPPATMLDFIEGIPPIRSYRCSSCGDSPKL